MVSVLQVVSVPQMVLVPPVVWYRIWCGIASGVILLVVAILPVVPVLPVVASPVVVAPCHHSTTVVPLWYHFATMIPLGTAAGACWILVTIKKLIYISLYLTLHSVTQT